MIATTVIIAVRPVSNRRTKKNKRKEAENQEREGEEGVGPGHRGPRQETTRWRMNGLFWHRLPKYCWSRKRWWSSSRIYQENSQAQSEDEERTNKFRQRIIHLILENMLLLFTVCYVE